MKGFNNQKELEAAKLANMSRRQRELHKKEKFDKALKQVQEMSEMLWNDRIKPKG